MYILCTMVFVYIILYIKAWDSYSLILQWTFIVVKDSSVTLFNDKLFIRFSGPYPDFSCLKPVSVLLSWNKSIKKSRVLLQGFTEACGKSAITLTSSAAAHSPGWNACPPPRRPSTWVAQHRCTSWAYMVSLLFPHSYSRLMPFHEPTMESWWDATHVCRAKPCSPLHLQQLVLGLCWLSMSRSNGLEEKQVWTLSNL